MMKQPERMLGGLCLVIVESTSISHQTVQVYTEMQLEGRIRINMW